MFRSAPTALRNAPSSAPLEAMVAKQQAHIDDLVSKNHTLEAKVQHLQAEISSEKTRYEDGLHKVKAQYDIERKRWKEEYDMSQGLWRISYLRQVVQVENSHLAILDMKDELRRARLASLQRDYQLEMFRAKESQQEYRIAQLEEEFEDAKWEVEEAGAQLNAAAKQVDILSQQLKQAAEDREEAVEEKAQLEVRRPSRFIFKWSLTEVTFRA